MRRLMRAADIPLSIVHSSSYSRAARLLRTRGRFPYYGGCIFDAPGGELDAFAARLRREKVFRAAEVRPMRPDSGAGGRARSGRLRTVGLNGRKIVLDKRVLMIYNINKKLISIG